MKHMKKRLTILLLIAGLFLSNLTTSAQQIKIDSSWVRDQEPFRIAGTLVLCRHLRPGQLSHIYNKRAHPH